MIFEGAIVFRITHAPNFRHEYLVKDDGVNQEWWPAKDDPDHPLVFFATHSAADKRAAELRTPDAWAGALTITAPDAETLPPEIRDHDPQPPRTRRIRSEAPMAVAAGAPAKVKLWGYDD